MIKCITWVAIFLSLFAGRQLLESYYAHQWMDQWEVELLAARSMDTVFNAPHQTAATPSTNDASSAKRRSRPAAPAKTKPSVPTSKSSMGTDVHLVASRSHEKDAPTRQPMSASPSVHKATDYKAKKRRQPVNINQADSALLTSIKGIGPVLSRRIIKYRNRLGGFHSKDQLKEVYGIKSEYWDAIAAQVSCSGRVVQLNVCDATFKEVLRHPYLDYEQVKAIKQVCDKMDKPGHDDRLSQLKVLLPTSMLPYLLLPGEAPDVTPHRDQRPSMVVAE